MSNTIKLKRSGVPGKVPTTGDLELGEVAINTADGLVHIKKLDGVESIVQIGDDRMRFKGEWLEIEYVKNDVVVDGEWTAVANKTTTDHAAPQEIGTPVWGIDPNSIFATAQYTGIVKNTQTYITTKSGFLTQLQIRVPNWDINNTVTKITTKVGNNFNVVSDPILANDEWVTLSVTGVGVAIGTEVIVQLEVYHQNDANTISGGWNCIIGTGVPANQSYNISANSASGTMVIDHTDLDGTERTTELRGVAIGSIITLTETGDSARSSTFRTSSADSTNTQLYSTYSYDIIDTGAKGGVRNGQTSTVNIDIPIITATDYSVIADGYLFSPEWANITSELALDGIVQGDLNDAYGINVLFQEATVSPDWDKLATSTSTGSSGGSGGDGIGEAPSDNTPYARQDATWVNTINSVVEDVSPQLGGDLDLNGFDINNTAGTININETINIRDTSNVSSNVIVTSPNPTGFSRYYLADSANLLKYDIEYNENTDKLILTNNTANAFKIDGLNWPQLDGTNGQVITTDGLGNLTFTSAAGLSEAPLDSTPYVRQDATWVSGITDLNSLTDVNASAPVSGDRLAWDENTLAWVPKRSQSALGFVELAYNWSSAPNPTPASGKISTNNASPTLVTILYINKLDKSNSDVSLFLSELKAGNWVNAHLANDADTFYQYDVTGDPVENLGVFEVPVAYFDHFGTLSNNNSLNVFLRYIDETAAGIPEAPVDATVYGRQDATWINVATTAQGTKADTAIQPNDNVSQLTNDAGYLTTGTLPANDVLSVDGRTGIVTLSDLYLSDAVSDNKTYGRNNGIWKETGTITQISGSTGISVSGGTGPIATITNTSPGSSQNIYKNIAVSGQSTISADSNNDTLTFANGNQNVIFTTNATTDTITANVDGYAYSPFGSQPNATGNSSIAIGNNANATAHDGVALGANTITNQSGIAIGLRAEALGNGDTSSIAIGRNAKATGIRDGVVIGRDANNSGQGGISIGPGATGNSDNTIIMGSSTINTNSHDSIILGHFSLVETGFGRSVVLGIGITVDDTPKFISGDGFSNNTFEYSYFGKMRLNSSNAQYIVPGYASNAFAQNGEVGSLIYDTTNKILKVHDGTSWKDSTPVSTDTIFGGFKHTFVGGVLNLITV